MTTMDRNIDATTLYIANEYNETEILKFYYTSM